jgi:putative membrane protein
MATASVVLAGFVAFLHLYFLVLEMFLWATPYGQKTFKRTAAEQEATKVLASNQGLYNGFLAAGLIWSMFANEALAMPLRIFFLGCVVIAGVYGAMTATKTILYAQALPGLLALAITLSAR